MIRKIPYVNACVYTLISTFINEPTKEYEDKFESYHEAMEHYRDLRDWSAVQYVYMIGPRGNTIHRDEPTRASGQ